MKLSDAIELARRAHAGQTDKAGKPYIEHPLRVMASQTDDVARMAAVLHDVVEDTHVTFHDLWQAGCPEAVLEAINLLTHRRGDPYEAYVARIKNHSVARAVKLADLADNLDRSRIARVTPKDLARFARYEQASGILRA